MANAAMIIAGKSKHFLWSAGNISDQATILRFPSERGFPLRRNLLNVRLIVKDAEEGGSLGVIFRAVV